MQIWIVNSLVDGNWIAQPKSFKTEVEAIQDGDFRKRAKMISDFTVQSVNLPK